MREILNKPVLITLTIFTFLFFLSLVVSNFIVKYRLDHVVYGSRFVQINEEFVSTIHPQKDGLSMLKIHMKNPALSNKEKIIFQLHENSELLRELEFSGSNVGDPGDLDIKFERIPDSAGKVYQLVLKIEGNDPKLSIYTDDNGKIAGWFYKQDNRDLSSVSDNLISTLSRFTSDKLFIMIWVMTLVFLFSLYRKSS